MGEALIIINPVDKMIQPIDISQPLLSDVLELSWSHEWSGHRGLYIVSTAWTPTYQS